MAKENITDLPTQLFFLAALTVIAIFILFVSIWVTTNHPTRMRILGRTCPQYPDSPNGCKFGVTTGSDKNGCLTLICYQPQPPLAK